MKKLPNSSGKYLKKNAVEPLHKGASVGHFPTWTVYLLEGIRPSRKIFCLYNNHVLYILCCRWSIMIEERPLSASRSSSIETLDTPVSVFGLALLSRNQNQVA